MKQRCGTFQKMRARLLMLAVLPTSCLPTSAYAYYAPLAFIPVQPVAGEQFSLRVGFGICDVLVVSGPQDREVLVQGRMIDVTAIGVYAPDKPFCIYPEGYADFDLGPLVPGTYTVRFFRRDLFVPSDVDLVQTGLVIVGAAAARPVPTNGFVSLALLTLALAATGMSRLMHISLVSRESP